MQGTSNWMNNLKLRLGYGVTGEASIDPYSSVATVELDGYYSLGGQKTNSYKFSENVANADLTFSLFKVKVKAEVHVNSLLAILRVFNVNSKP